MYFLNMFLKLIKRIYFMKLYNGDRCNEPPQAV